MSKSRTWLPKIGEYYYFTSYKKLIYAQNLGWECDARRIKTGRVYKTEKDAENAIRQKYIKGQLK